MSTYYSLQGVYDSVQIFALILSSVGKNADENRFRQHKSDFGMAVRIQSEHTENAWRQILLGTV